MINNLFQIRVTGLLIENGKILLVNQKVSSSRSWSLPGGRLEQGETIEEGIVRELYEETGLNVKIIKLLYICEKTDVTPPLLHITFMLERVCGEIKLPTNEYDKNPIHDVKFIDIDDLTNYGFSELFQDIIKKGFPNAGNYMGEKSAIGL
ncbi:NUDIX hydrolase [Tissierella carlieri]|uniref:NUDIX hydrolase n=1 Tax=Tissierella carlieri TaxID=689904 RepID=UPI003864786C